MHWSWKPRSHSRTHAEFGSSPQPQQHDAIWRSSARDCLPSPLHVPVVCLLSHFINFIFLLHLFVMNCPIPLLRVFLSFSFHSLFPSSSSLHVSPLALLNFPSFMTFISSPCFFPSKKDNKIK